MLGILIPIDQGYLAYMIDRYSFDNVNLAHRTELQKYVMTKHTNNCFWDEYVSKFVAWKIET